MSRRHCAAIALIVGATLLSACTQVSVGGRAAATTNDPLPQSDSLILSNKTFPLSRVRCLATDGGALVAAKTEAGENIIVGSAANKLESLVFKADGVSYFWEPTSTGGAPDPVFMRDGDTYTVTGKIKQLEDATKFSDFAVRLTCPN